jgi:hypothetical protein
VRSAGPVSLFGTACLLTVASQLPAQTRADAGLDLGMAHVSYDDFLPSLAAFAAVDGSLATRRTDVSARGAAVRYESGRHAFQASLGAAYLAPGAGPGETSASAGASWYADFARFARARRAACCAPGAAGPGSAPRSGRPPTGRAGARSRG